MSVLIAGLLVFLGAHSLRIVAEPWRARQIARLGEQRWKGLYSIVSLLGFALIVWGYGMTRAEPVTLWEPPLWTRHAAALLTAPIFVLIAAAYIPGTRIKAALGHPMLVGVKLWALAHLISNGRLGDVLLFGAFLVWAVFDFKAARARDRAAGTRYPSASLARDAVAVAIGLALWAAFAFHLHAWLIGVGPFG
ncbi:MAG: NnrU family protein [Burkholderiales bacterium]|nr:NnrU family protein [Burkholderiales bacterium]